VHTPVETVGRFTIESIDPQGSLGVLGVGEGEAAGTGELDGAASGWPKARPVIAASPQANAAAPRSVVRNMTRPL